MAFTAGTLPFPGVTVRGVVPDALKEALYTFNAKALNALQTPPAESIAWADEVSDVGAADFVEKIPIDITALNGFKPFKGGARDFKEIDLIAVAVEIQEFDLPVNYKSKLAKSGDTSVLMNLGNIGMSIVGHARSLKAEMAAALLMSSIDTKLYTSLTLGGYAAAYVPTAMCYPEIGFPLGMPLFSSTNAAYSNNGGHLANPRDSRFGHIANYFPNFGKFSPDTFAKMRLLMRTVPSPVTERRTLGGQVSYIVAPSHMEEPLRQVALATLTGQYTQINGVGVANTATGIYSTGITPWRYGIASQLDHHPFLENFRAKYLAANGTLPTPDQLPHCWMSVTKDLLGANPMEFAAPSASFMPHISIFGIGSDHEIMTKMFSIIPDMEVGVAPAVPHVCQWFEETLG